MTDEKPKELHHCRSCKKEVEVNVEESGAGVKVIRCKECDSLLTRIKNGNSTTSTVGTESSDVSDSDLDEAVNQLQINLLNLHSSILAVKKQGCKVEVGIHDNDMIHVDVYRKIVPKPPVIKL